MCPQNHTVFHLFITSVNDCQLLVCKGALNHYPTYELDSDTVIIALCTKPTIWNDCGRNPKQRWSAWRTSWPLSELAGPSSPGSQKALLLTHAPTPGTCPQTGTTASFELTLLMLLFHRCGAGASAEPLLPRCFLRTGQPFWHGKGWCYCFHGKTITSDAICGLFLPVILMQ